jgi:UDP-N-acetylglucosamine transferase subunit ALG13
MIFVTVGSAQAFDRLIAAVDRLQTDEDVVVQYGPSAPPTRPGAVQFVSYEEIVAYMTAARVIVTHAGVGSILTAIRLGKRPVVVPRQRRLGEAVDDHQLHLAKRLANQGIVILADELSQLGSLVGLNGKLDAPAASGTALAADLHEYIERLLGPPAG